MTKPTVIAFIDLQFNGTQWKTGETPREREQGWFKSTENHAEVHLVALDGTFRQIFFSKDTVMRISGNTLWFNASDTDYLLTDHNKKYPKKKEINDK